MLSITYRVHNPPYRTVRINFEIGYAGIDLSANLIHDV